MPTSRYGKYGTWNQTVGVKLDIDDAIVMLSPTDVPLLSRIGSRGTNQVKVEWLEEDLTPQSVTVTAVAGASSPWTITVSATDINYIRPNDILWKQDAASTVQFTVTSINTAGPTAVVAGFAGNATGPAVNDVLVIVGQYGVEGKDPEEARSVERESKFNYTEIFQEKIAATRTARGRDLYGQADPYDHETMKKFKEVRIRWERASVHGQRAISAGSDQRSMGGVLYYITSNTESGLKANSKTLINSLMRKVYDAGGAAGTLMVSPSLKQAISENVDPTLRRSERSDRTGGFVVDFITTDFGEVTIVPNRFFPKTKGVLMQEEFIIRRPFSPAFHELLSKTGDSDVGEIVEESSLEVKNEKAHGVLTITDA